MAALFARADCYVSLHRAEGFGLTLAESMALGKPVIATGFSGNTDFMTPANSYLVDWALTEVGPEAEHYPEEGTWAEPSIEHAAQLMREVYGDQEAAAARGARAAADVAAWLSPDAVGSIARDRLVRIGRRRRAAPPAGATAAPAAGGSSSTGSSSTSAVGTAGARRGWRDARCSAPCSRTPRRSERSTARWRRRSGSSGSSSTPTARPAAASRRGSHTSSPRSASMWPTCAACRRRCADSSRSSNRR